MKNAATGLLQEQLRKKINLLNSHVQTISGTNTNYNVTEMAAAWRNYINKTL